MQRLDTPKKQSGAILVMGLLFMVVMTMLGITSLSNSSMGEQMTGNLMNLDLAFQSAESGLKDGENFINALTEKPIANSACGTPPCNVWLTGSLPDLTAQDHTWWTTNGRTYSSSLGNNMVATQSRHTIEEEYFIPDDLNPETLAAGIGIQYYRVTSRGTGSTDTSQSIVQSVFAIRY